MWGKGLVASRAVKAGIVPPPGPPGPPGTTRGSSGEGARPVGRGEGAEAVEAAAAGSQSELGRDGKRGVHSVHVEAPSPHPPMSQEGGLLTHQTQGDHLGLGVGGRQAKHVTIARPDRPP